MSRVSRPGLRQYRKKRHLEKSRVLNGAGVAILTTNKGIMTDRAARKEGVGGEILCIVY
jgi:small subunit ribosomal protein S8